MTMKAAAAGPGKPPGTGKAAEAGPDPRRPRPMGEVIRRPGLEYAPDMWPEGLQQTYQSTREIREREKCFIT